MLLMFIMQTQSALQDAKGRIYELLKEKSEWIEQKREHERTHKALLEAEEKAASTKVYLQALHDHFCVILNAHVMH